ncbi:MAG: hypothetical protein J6V40_04070, partial [Clostridia bacterium]|nr:hypothetical protein [Clostridia bacterium]
FDVVLEFPSNDDFIANPNQAVTYYDINTADGVYTVVNYIGSSHNDLRINFSQLGTTGYSNTISIDSSKLAWNYDIDINKNNKTVTVDADKDIIVFKISKGTEASKLHKYDSTATNNEHILLNNTTHYNYIVALNNDNEACLYRIVSNTVSETPLINFVDTPSATYMDSISMDQSELVIISYTYNSSTEKLDIVFKVCKNNAIELTNDYRISKENALDISRVEILKETSATGKISINDYYMDIFILNVDAGAATLVATSGHYCTDTFNNTALTFNATKQAAYAILEDSSTHTAGIFRYISQSRAWLNLNVPMSSDTQQLYVDNFQVDGTNVSIALNYTYNSADKKFTGLSFSKLNYHDTTTNVLTLHNKGIELSTALNPNFQQITTSNLSVRYYNINGLVSQNANYTPVYFVRNSDGVLTSYNNPNDFITNYDRLNTLYTMSRDKVVEKYVLNKINITANIDQGADPDSPDDDTVAGYTANNIESNIDFVSEAGVTYNYNGTDMTYSELMDALFELSIAKTENLNNYLPTIYPSNGSFMINGKNDNVNALNANVYLIKQASDPYKYIVRLGTNLREPYLESDEIYILSSNTRFDVKLLTYNFTYLDNDPATITDVMTGADYDTMKNMLTEEDIENLPTMATFTSTSTKTTPVFDRNYYLNYTPAGNKTTAIIVNKNNNSKVVYDAVDSLTNIPFSLNDNLLFLFTASENDYVLWYYYNNMGSVTTIELSKNQTNKIEKMQDAYIKYTVGAEYTNIELSIYITTISSTDLAASQNISTLNLASTSMITLNNQNKFTMPKFNMLLLGIDVTTNNVTNNINSFVSNVAFDIGTNYYYLIAGSDAETELYLYKLTYNSSTTNFEWQKISFFNSTMASGIIDDTDAYQKIAYAFDNNSRIRTISFTAYANKTDSTSLDSYYKVWYSYSALDVSKTEIIHNKQGAFNINTTAQTLTTNEIYVARFLTLTYTNNVLKTVSITSLSKGEITAAPNQKLYVILSTTDGTNIYPALFRIDFQTDIPNNLHYVNITDEGVGYHNIDLSLADTELYFEDNNAGSDLFIIYKFSSATSIQINFVDLDTDYTTFTSIESKDFNPQNDTVTPTITISDGVVSLESPSPLSFVIIDKKEYKETEIYEMSNGSFEFNSVTQILYTFKIEQFTPEGEDEAIDILNLYRYDYSSTDVNFPFKLISTLEVDATITDITAVEEEDYYEYCDIDYYEDIYTIIKYVCNADFKLVINFAKLYPAFVNIGGYFAGATNDTQIVEIIGVPYSYTAESGQFALIIRPETVGTETINLNINTRSGVKPMVYTVDDVDYTTYITYTITLDTNGVYLNVKYVLGYMEIYEGTKQSISHVGSGSDGNPEYGSKTERVTYQKIHHPIPSGTNIEEFNSLIRYVGTDLSSTQDNLIKYYTSETTSPIESSVNIDIFGLKNYYNLLDEKTDNGYAEMKYNDVNKDIKYISDVTNIYIKSNANYDSNVYDDVNPVSADFLSELLGDNQIDVDADGIVTAKTADIDPTAPFSLNNLIITNVTPTFWTYLCNFLYDSSNKISQSLIYKYDYDLIYDEWGSLKQLTYDSSEYTTYYLTKDTEINDDGLYQIIIKYTYNKYKYLDADSNVLDGDNVIFYQLFTFIVNNNTPTLTISVGDDVNGYTLIGTSNYTNKGVKISWVATTEFQNYEYISITNTNFDGTTNFVATYNPIDMSISAVGNDAMAKSITTFTYDEDLKSYVVTINENVDFGTNGAYKVRLHYGVNQSSYSTYSFNIDTEQISGLRLYAVETDENNLYYTTEELREGNTPIQIVNKPFTLAFNQKSSGAKINSLYYKLTLNQSNDYSQLLHTIINTQDYDAVTTNFVADGTLNTTNSFMYNYKYNVDGVGDYINSQCYINPSKPTIYMFYLYDNAGNACRYFVFYDTTTPKYIISPELKNGYNIINDATSITWGDYKAIKILTPQGFNVDLTDYTTNAYSDLSNYSILQSILMYINSNTANFKGTLVKVIDGEYYLLVPLGDKVIDNDNTNYSYTIDAGLANTSKFYLFTSSPNSLNVDINTGEIILDITGKLVDVDYKIINSPSVTNIGSKDSTYISVSYTYKGQPHNIIGAYGEYKYYFTINDVLGNNLTNFMWMNFDQTQGFAWASFSTAVSMDDIYFISPDNTYS